MTVHEFNRDWTVRAGDRAPALVNLPHDAMLDEPREPNCANGLDTGFFPGGVYTYRKGFYAPREWRENRVALFFEGAYHRSGCT